MISLLILRRNTVVRTDEFIDELWEEGPPASAMTTLQTYIYKLRKIFAEYAAGEVLCTQPGGYTLTVPDSSIDLCQFERDAGQGEALLEASDPLRAAETLRRALGMWRGQALADVVQGGLLSSYATRLEESRSRMLELRIEADLQLGRHRELISELKSLILSQPLHEHLHAALMVALHRSGRRHEALETYRDLRRNMIDDLGLEPGQELKQLQQALLADSPLGWPFQRGRPAASPAPSREPAPAAATAAATAVPPRQTVGIAAPAQLPADVADFTGRVRIISDVVVGFLPPQATAQERTATPVAAITGMPGVGKSALAIHIAHKLRPQFNDGQLYAELRNECGHRRDVSEAVRGFLGDLGVPEAQIPDGLEERGKLFRSATAGRRLLVVVDDVRSAADVRHLLPGDPRCAVIVTSRRRLHGLAGVWDVGLDSLEHAESIELLARIIGHDRLEHGRQAADKLAELSGGLPLALRCMGSWLATRPTFPIAEMVEQLARAPQTLDVLRLGDLDVRSRYDSIYESLGRLERGIFRLLSMLPAAGFTAEAAADLLGWEAVDVERALDGLVDDHMIRVVHRDDGEIRYAFPELTLSYARERLTSTLNTESADSFVSWAGEEHPDHRVRPGPALPGRPPAGPGWAGS